MGQGCSAPPPDRSNVDVTELFQSAATTARPAGPPRDCPTEPPREAGLVDNCILCLPEAACAFLGVKPNINDKGCDKRLWMGRAWQIRALQLQRYREMLARRADKLTAKAKKELDDALADPIKKKLLLKVQCRMRGAVTRRRGIFGMLSPLGLCPSTHFATVLFMHGSGGMTYNNVRYARTLANMGVLVIAPDSMAGGEFRSKELSQPIRSEQATPYWGDIGLYASDAKGAYAYSTEAKAVVEDPEKWRELYSNVYRMRRNEMHWILGHLPQYIRKAGIFTMGQSEGAMTVARFDDQRYGAMIRGRIISAFNIEYCYFTPTREAGRYGGSTDVPTLNIIGDADQFFGCIESVAKSVIGMKDKGGYGAEDFTGNGFKNMKRQKLRRGLTVVLAGARHDASETHDNFLRDLLHEFMRSPGQCHMVPEFWVVDAYLSKLIKVVETDSNVSGIRVLMKVGKMDYPATLPYDREQLYRVVGRSKMDKRRLDELDQADKEASTLLDRAKQEADNTLAVFRNTQPKFADVKESIYITAKNVKDMPLKLHKRISGRA